jgi:hypothetical protein
MLGLPATVLAEDVLAVFIQPDIVTAAAPKPTALRNSRRLLATFIFEYS